MPDIYSVTVRFATDDPTDDHLNEPGAIGDEIRSWLESLHAPVLDVRIKKDVVQ